MSLRTLIVDDELPARLALRKRLEAHARTVTVCGEAHSARSAMDAIEQLRPDLVFLDIRMPGLSGLELARSIAAAGGPMVIFLTAYAEKALAGFEVGAVDYLTKPINPDRLAKAVARAADRRALARQAQLGETLREAFEGFAAPDATQEPAKPRFIQLAAGDRTLTLDPRSIDYLEAARDYTCVACGSQTHVVRRSMSALEREIDLPSFVRCHRSYIVNMDRVVQLIGRPGGGHSLQLIDGRELPVSRRRYEALRMLLTPEE